MMNTKNTTGGKGPVMQEVLESAREIETDFTKKWQADGKPILGYSCLATPIEVMEAAGVLPYRLRALGNNRTELADAHLSRFNCSFCRSLLQLGLEGVYKFLDGLVETNGCDHLRGMFENWQYAGDVPYMHYVKVPHVVTDDSINYFEEEVHLFVKAMAEKFRKEISDEDLWAAIMSQNLVRERMRTLQLMRERKDPAFSGTEVLSIFLAGTAMPSDEYAKLLEGVIGEREGHAIKDYRARLMICGSATDEIDFIRAIEETGGQLVADSFCYGTWAYWEIKREDGKSPQRALAESYLNNLLCPRMFDDYASRRDYVFGAIERADVNGVILVHNKFCDVHGADNVELRMDLEKKNIPVLQLEKEYGGLADLGRIKTRVQAFLERIGDR